MEPSDINRLEQLLREALSQADVRGDTLIAALLAECIDAVEQERAPPSSPPPKR